MVRIRKSVLALIIVLALAVGGAAGGFAGMRARNYIETENGIVVSREEFDDYQYLVDTYGKADFIRDYILENYYTDVDEAELDEGLYYGLFAGLGDVYSGYFTAEDYDYMMSSLTGTYSGVGITISGAAESGTAVESTAVFKESFSIQG